MAAGRLPYRGERLSAFVQRTFAETAGISPWGDRPVREELFSAERLEEHARNLAGAQAVAVGQRQRDRLRPRLLDNEAALVATYRDVADTIGAGESITPAAEWLIDNFHLVESQIREIRLDMPFGYYRLLPKLAGGPFAGLPRVFSLAWAFVAHTDSLFDPEALRRFVRAYQDVQPLMIGELWAVAITLRFVLVENLRRLAGRVAASHAGRREANLIADRLLGAGGRAVEPAATVLASYTHKDLSEAFFVQLVQRLRDQDPSIAPALVWIDDRLAEHDLAAESVVQAEHQRQVTAGVTVRNIITSMRLISDVDWSDLVERISLVDDILGAESEFAAMDFPTRNLYRSAIERLARGAGRSELDIARAALAAAEAARPVEGPDARLADPGYYLIAEGRRSFEAAIGYRAPLAARPMRFYRSLGIGGYVAAGGLLASLVLAAPLAFLAREGLAWPWLLALGALGLAPAVDVSVALVNFVLTRGVRATLLPGLALKNGVPAPLRTLVAVPSLLTSLKAVESLVETLEIHYLASLGGELHFALLTDWTDEVSEHVEGDDDLLGAARAAVAELNRRYGPAPGGDRFFLLHRRRVWNVGEGRWIGWERKRGKLTELNRLLRDSTETTFIDPPPMPAGVRYVLTLDSDTRLPRETARRLIGKMAHPLNRPALDPASSRVVEGYAILQPRVTPALPVGREGSLFLRVFSSAAGIDPYAAAVSDVYQDLFGEGSYTGKGIYEIDAFEAALAGRAPESRLLSHDLFEGVFARAGLASDVEVVEDFPARYDTSALRHHRWARGDWQLAPWMLGLGPKSPGGGPRDRMPMIGRWKMLDNIRRSLSAPSIVAALLGGWAAPGAVALPWTFFIVLTMAVPPLLPVAAELLAPRQGVAMRNQLRAVTSDLGVALMQLGLMLVFLAHQAWLMGDAIVRALVRLTITHRRLLEWTPAAQAAFGAKLDVFRFYRRMAGALAIAAAGAGAAWLGGGDAWPLALGFGVAWALSPLVAYRVSLAPPPDGGRPLSAPDGQALRLIARRTWRYFETFVTASTHMLPPDNFQETPEPVVAHRTSPTNIGLYLLSTASARDFGWIGETEALERLEATMGVMTSMTRHRGHFYNWYDTTSLRPLEPQYVSTVDSGNLAGHLIALAGACRDWTGESLTDRRRVAGVLDAISLARETLLSAPQAGRRKGDARLRLLRQLEELTQRVDEEGAPRWASLAAEIERAAHAAQQVTIDEGLDLGADILFWIEAAGRCVESHRRDGQDAAERAERLERLEEAARAMALATDFTFLLDPDRLLLSIGYQTADATRDPSCYDLLASEARLASFVAIAKGDVPSRHWFRLGRTVTPIDHGAALVSWSGSMFEYLMPSLVMDGPAASLIEESNRLIVERQIAYGRQRGAPWGVSESAYNARDLELTYQYSNFGVPGLGLKRGLADNLVIAPYATALAAMIDPEAALLNFKRLAAAGARGRHGYYEAIDMTPARVPEGERMAIVRAYMAHHQGMSVVAIADALLGRPMRARFHADPIVRATELLLQERVPRDVVSTPPSVAETTAATRERGADGGAWRAANPWSATPDTQLLSNGRYTVMLTAAGAGYSVWKDIAITRWREDATCDDWGAWIYLRDVRSDAMWSAGLQPTGARGEDYAVVFNEDRAQISRRDGAILTTLEVLVSSEDDAEVRRVTLANVGSQAREIEVTSYAELVLATPAADAAHPAFSKLFIETEHLAGMGAIVAHRRRRGPDEPEIWAAHLAVVAGDQRGQREFETDRARFIGRGDGPRAPAAVLDGRPLSGAAGAVLDPIFALRRRLRIEPGQSARIDFWTMAAPGRAEILDLVDKHHDGGAFERAAALAWTQVQVQLHHLGVRPGQAGQFQRLAGHMLYASPTMRAPSEAIQAGRGPQPLLWSLGISGDLPIILVRIADIQEIELVREALLAVEYWRIRRLAVDLVILNERGASYVQDLQVALEQLVRANQSRPLIGDEPAAGHTFLLRADLVAQEARAMLLSIARVVLIGERGRLEDQLAYAPEAKVRMAPIGRPAPARSELQVARPASEMEYFNGLGGFAADGTEYVTVLGPGQSTPAPWVNVIANPDFGFQVSAEGAGYSWSLNSREHQISSWSNDPVTDPPSQVIYIRDDDTGAFWTPTAKPIRDESATYVARHGFGYSRFVHASHGVAVELLEQVAPEDPVRLSQLTLRNTSGSRRRLTVTAYVELSLGTVRGASAPFVCTRLDEATHAILASNSWSPAYAGRVSFLDMAGRQASWTGDRREFIGRNGGLAEPLALSDPAPLSGRLGAGLDPCAALQTTVELAAGESVTLAVVLGDAAGEDEARELIVRYRKANLADVLSEVRRRWVDLLGAVKVKTPDRTMDLMLNGWLLYQTVSARLWARAGFYQASGAYGFRDQLQDVMALAAISPGMTREQLLRAAARQFAEGDVQHWWLPVTGQGIRTRISDDRAWLAFVTAHYVEASGDAAALDEPVGFLAGEPLQPGEVERFFAPGVSADVASLYEHAARALDASLAIGPHGLPLMGSGDWNDGMNLVGPAGRGESVWLGWFLIATLTRFAAIAEARGDGGRATAWRSHAEALRAAAEREAWDGEWYRRAWFDDGAPLGSTSSEECRIDAIAQSWAVLSGAGSKERAARAMASVERELILPQESLALIFAPPFDRTPLDPGYIKGYPPGVRENGGQYTHAALWSVMAFAELGEGDKAAALFWLLNPINHTRTRGDVHRYRVEPYVVAADVSSSAGQAGRGGWTWYTGSAGWMQRAGVEAILGVRTRNGFLEVDPCIPASWPGYQVTLKLGEPAFEIVVDNPARVSRGVALARLDGQTLADRPVRVPIGSGRATRRLEITLGSA